MTILTSQISTTSETFTANTKRMQALVGDIQAKAELVIKGGTDEARERHISRGKLLPRDRLAQLLDAGSPFLEIGQFAAWGMYDDTYLLRRPDRRDRTGFRQGSDDRRQ